MTLNKPVISSLTSTYSGEIFSSYIYLQEFLLPQLVPELIEEDTRVYI